MITLQGQNSQIMQMDEYLAVRRELTAYYVDGRVEKSDVEEFHIRCNVQTVSGRDLLMVPEGDRNREMYWVFTENRTQNLPVLALNDRIIREGVNFQVQTVENWGAFVRGRMVRIDIGPHRST